jgi:hypothetical protein
MAAKKFCNVTRRQQGHRKKTCGAHSHAVSPHEHDWPRRLAITVKIKDETVVIAWTIALSMPYTEGKNIFHACIIRDKRRTDCLMDREGYLKVLKMLSSISFPILSPSPSYCVMSRELLVIIEIEETCCPRRLRWKWKNPDPETSHCLEYIWGFFGRVVQKQNPDVRLDDLMCCE